MKLIRKKDKDVPVAFVTTSVEHALENYRLSAIKYIDTELKCFVMGNNTNVPIRREFLTKAKKALENYLFDRTRGLIN